MSQSEVLEVAAVLHIALFKFTIYHNRARVAAHIPNASGNCQILRATLSATARDRRVQKVGRYSSCGAPAALCR